MIEVTTDYDSVQHGVVENVDGIGNVDLYYACFNDTFTGSLPDDENVKVEMVASGVSYNDHGYYFLAGVTSPGKTVTLELNNPPAEFGYYVYINDTEVFGISKNTVKWTLLSVRFVAGSDPITIRIEERNDSTSGNDYTYNYKIIPYGVSEDDLNELKQQIIELDNTIEERDNEIDDLNIQINNKDLQIEELNLQIEDLNREIEELNSQIEDLKNADDSSETIAALREEVQNLTQEINDLNNKLTEKDIIISELEEKIAELEPLEEQNKELIEENNKLTEQIKNLNNQIISLQNTITELENRVSELNSQNQELINRLNSSSGGANLDDVTLNKIKELEKKLSETTSDLQNVSKELNDLKESVREDIISTIGDPRFGIMPLPIAKQAKAVAGELLTNLNGHLYLKDKNGNINSKTVENENRLNDHDQWNYAGDNLITIDSVNIEHFLDDSNDKTYINADNTISSTNAIITMSEMMLHHIDITDYYILVNTALGAISNVKFKNSKTGELYDTKLMNSDDNQTLYKLSKEINAEYITPVITMTHENAAINSIILYRGSALINSAINSGGTEFGPDIDPSLIEPPTIVNPDGSYSLSRDHRIKIRIPYHYLKNGLYSLTLFGRGNVIINCTVQMTFDNTIVLKKNLPFSKISKIGSGKSANIEIFVPEHSTGFNYLEIISPSTDVIIVEYIMLRMIIAGGYEHSNL